MMSRVFVLAVWSAAASVAGAQQLEDLAGMMQGRFDSHPPGTDVATPAEQRIVDSRQRLDAPELGDAVFYLQLNQGAELKLYRQRVLVLSVDPENGVITQKAYTLKEAEKFVDARSGDAILETLSENDIEPMFREGCGQRWTADGDAFRGYTDPATCRIISSRTGKPRRIEAVNLLSKNGLSLVERGYDDDMNQLFGTPPGDSTVLRRVE